MGIMCFPYLSSLTRSYSDFVFYPKVACLKFQNISNLQCLFLDQFSQAFRRIEVVPGLFQSFFFFFCPFNSSTCWMLREHNVILKFFPLIEYSKIVLIKATQPKKLYLALLVQRMLPLNLINQFLSHTPNFAVSMFLFSVFSLQHLPVHLNSSSLTLSYSSCFTHVMYTASSLLSPWLTFLAFSKSS